VLDSRVARAAGCPERQPKYMVTLDRTQGTTRDRRTRASYFTVRPCTITPEGSVHSQGSPAGPNPYGQINLPTLHSRSVNSSFSLSKKPGAGGVWRREAGVVLVLLQAKTFKHVETTMAQPKPRRKPSQQRRKTSRRLVFSFIFTLPVNSMTSELAPTVRNPSKFCKKSCDGS
jgi:hypothetical protein